MEKGKQIRMVCHLEYNGEHYYFGNLKVLTEDVHTCLQVVDYQTESPCTELVG